MAIVQSDVAHWARLGEGPFAGVGAFDDLRLLFPVHDETLTVLVKRNISIDDIADFRGKRIAIAGSKSGSHATTEALLDALGWSQRDFASFTSEPMADEIEALCANQTDITLLVVGHPNGFVQRALNECNARLERFTGAEVERALKKMPFLHMGTIEAGRYARHQSPVAVPALAATVVARRELSNAVVERFVSTLFAHEETLRKLHPAFSELNLRREIPLMKDIERHAGLPSR
jgi:TRAP transporter TAXI family solute receptor